MSEACQPIAARDIHRNYKCGPDFSWPKLFKQIFPDNAAAYVASFTKTSVAAARHVMRGRNGLSGAAVVNLLRSPVGPRVLDAIVGDAEWRANERRLLAIADLEFRLEEQKRRLASLQAHVAK